MTLAMLWEESFEKTQRGILVENSSKFTIDSDNSQGLYTIYKRGACVKPTMTRSGKYENRTSGKLIKITCAFIDS